MLTHNTIRQIALTGALWLIGAAAILPIDAIAARNGGGGGGRGNGGGGGGGGGRQASAPAVQSAPRGGGGGGGRADRASAPAPQMSRTESRAMRSQAPRSVEPAQMPQMQSAQPSVSRQMNNDVPRTSGRIENNSYQNAMPQTVAPTVRQNRSVQQRTPVIRNRTVEVAGSEPRANRTERTAKVIDVDRGVSAASERTVTTPQVERSTKQTARAQRSVTDTITAPSRRENLNTNSETRVTRNNGSERKTTDSALREKVVEPVRVESSTLQAKADRVESADLTKAQRQERQAERQANGTAEKVRGTGERTAARQDRTTERERTAERSIAAADGDRTTITTESKTVTTRERTGRTLARTDEGERSLRQSNLKEETVQRARVAGTERVTARASDDFKNRRLIAASETSPRRATTVENTSKLVVRGDNNVIVQGDLNVKRPRPYIAPRLYHRNLAYYHDDWHHHNGVYFSFGWSSSSCGRVIWAPYYSSWGFSYYYPHYHRKFVFVSIGGYWPVDYHYRRYYWYGCHPHYWYGSYIMTEPPVYNTYNTYNYYNTTPSTGTTTTTTNVYDNPPLTTTEDVTTPIDAPNDENIVDVVFAHGVKVFGEGNYPEAIERFRRAVQMDSEDVILPFTYSQALFANGDYALAASVLRGAVQNIPDDELTIYYPRGLYEDEKVLTDQVQRLESAVAGEPFSADYQLLLGYQYLGMGDLQKARGPLTEAVKDAANKDTAMKLLELADRLEAENAKAQQEQTDTTSPAQGLTEQPGQGLTEQK